MSSQRFEGKNLEEALQSAATNFGVERYQLAYHVVMEKRGFLGGVKRIVIEAEPAEATTDAPAPQNRSPERFMPEPPARRQRSERPGERTREVGRGAGIGRGGEQGGARRGGRGGRGAARDGRGSRREESPDRTAEASVVVDDRPLPPQEPESELALRVRAWCQELFQIAHLDVELHTAETDEIVAVGLYGADVARFLVRDGELLDSVQVIANKSLIARDVEKKIEFDCQDFKVQRTESLGQRAQEMAALVRSDGAEQLLPAMSPVERRIVHLALESDPEVTTESRGEGFYKRVAIVRRQGQPNPMES